jgi:hypothetical protein
VLVHEAVVAEAEDVDELGVDALPGRGRVHELSAVGARVPQASDDLVTAGHDVLGLHPRVRERRQLHPEEGQDPVLRGGEPGKLLVLDDIVRQVPPEPVDVVGRTPRGRRR